MLGFLSIVKSKPFAMGLAGLVIVTILYLGYRHYNGLLNEVQDLKSTQAVLETGLDIERSAVRELSNVVGDWEASRRQLLAKIEEMQEEAHEARAETRRLRELFAEIDFESMEPAAVDSVAHDIVDRLWSEFRAATDPSRHSDSGTAGSDSTATDADADSDDERELGSDRDVRGEDAGADSTGVRTPGP